jgi:hypothetical protein
LSFLSSLSSFFIEFDLFATSLFYGMYSTLVSYPNFVYLRPVVDGYYFDKDGEMLFTFDWYEVFLANTSCFTIYAFFRSNPWYSPPYAYFGFKKLISLELKSFDNEFDISPARDSFCYFIYFSSFDYFYFPKDRLGCFPCYLSLFKSFKRCSYFPFFGNYYFCWIYSRYS